MSVHHTPEQRARDFLARLGVEGAQNFSAELVELANLFADHDQLMVVRQIEAIHGIRRTEWTQTDIEMAKAQNAIG